MDIIDIRELNNVNSTHVAIKQAFEQFSSYYQEKYSHNPSIYVTYHDDPKDLSHVDISCGHPDYPSSSKPYVLYHFWAYCKRTSLLSDHVLALALHTPTHLHIQKSTDSAVAGYYAEVVNPDRVKYGNWNYLFWNDDKTLDNLRVFYSAYPLLSDDGEFVKPDSNGKTKHTYRYFIIVFILIIFVLFVYYQMRNVNDDFAS